ncbi:hypothetical protein BASA81_012848 [Batrachochytrium salamandrivorans]|nr:hypothetical protein BASA81_012848 [Batrachochytrium salamandrivorans]
MVECPLIVMLLLQLHPSYLKDLSTLLPIMLKAMSVRIPTDILGSKLTAKEQRCKQFRFESFLACDVKTLSFLVYVLLSHSDKISPRESELAYNVFILLKTVPAECVSVRKELLVATRHILSTECAKAFAPYLNALLDESVLLGEQGGRFELATQPFPQPFPIKTSPQTQALPQSSAGVQQRIPQRKQPLVHLACAALVDLVQTMRGSMDLAQLTRVVYIFTRMVHDPALPLSMQATCVRLLLNLVDGIYHYHDANSPQQSERIGAFTLLQRILDCLVRKLGTIRSLIPKVKPSAGSAPATPSSLSSSSSTPAAAATVVEDSKMERTESMSNLVSPDSTAPVSSAPGAAATAPQVVSIPVLANGYSGVRRRRPAVPGEVDKRELDRSFIIGISSHPNADPIPPPEPVNSMRDVCYVVRIIVAGLKTVFFCLTNIDQQGKPPSKPSSSANGGGSATPPPAPPRPMSDEDIRLVSKFFCWTLQCLPAFRYQASLEPHEEGQIDNNEESDVLELFAISCTLLESSSFTDLLAKNMDFFYLCMLRNPLVQRVANHFLRSASTSRAFTSVLVPFLLSRFSLLSGRYGPVFSSLESMVDNLTKNRDEGEVSDLSWPLVCAPAHKCSEPKVFESTYYGGWLAPKLDVSKVPQSGVDAVLTPQGLGLESAEDTFLANKQEVWSEFPKDDEAHLLFKLFRSAFHSTIQLTKSAPSPQANESAVALFAAYIEPSVTACFVHAAETNAFPLQPLRSGVFVKIEEDQAENSVVVLRSILACVLDAPNEIRESLLPIIKRLAKPMARCINKLLIVNDFTDPLSLARADNLSDLAVSLAFLLADDPNLVALPLSHALSSSTRGNDVLVSKALSALERLVPSNNYDRISIARGGLVSKGVKALLKSPMHLAQAMRLEGKCTTEYAAQVFFYEERNDHPVKFPVVWNCGESELDLTRTVVSSLLERDQAMMLRNDKVFDALLTCACDAELLLPARALVLELVLTGPSEIGRALARLFVIGCPHRALAGREILTSIDQQMPIEYKRKVILDGLLPVLLQCCTNKSWQERTGAFAGLKFIMETSLTRELCVRHETQLCDTLLFGLKHHAMEFGHDVLFHLGNALDVFLAHIESPKASLNKFVFALYRCEEARSRRILRGAIYSVLVAKPHHEEMVFNSFQDLLHSNPSTTRSKGEAVVSIFAAKTDFFLFYLELFPKYVHTADAQAKEVSFIFEFFQDVLLRWKTFFVADDDREAYDMEAYCFSYYPRSVTLKSSFLLLGWQLVKILGVAISQKRANFVGELMQIVFAGVASSYPALSHAAFNLLATLARVEPFLPYVKTSLAEYVATRIMERGALQLTVFSVRGLGLVLLATKHLRLVNDNFPVELLNLVNDRMDSTKVLTNPLQKKPLPGEEVAIPNALLDLFCHLPTASQYLEQMFTILFKLENSLGLFHFSRFPIGTKPIVGVFCGSKLSSPYRPTMSRFMALHPTKVLHFILSGDRLIKRSFSAFLSDSLRVRTKFGDVLRKELVENSQTLKLFLSATFQAKYEAPVLPVPTVAAGGVGPPAPLPNNDPNIRRAGARVVELRFLGLRFLRNVLKWNPEFLSVHPELVQQVLAVLRSSEEKLQMEEKLPLRHQKVTKLSCKCIIAGFKSSSVSSSLVGVLTDLLPMTFVRSSMDPTFLLEFFHKICKKSNPMFVREILTRFTLLLDSKSSSPYLKEASLRLVVIPVLSLVMYNKAMLQKPQVPASLPIEASTLEILIKLIIHERVYPAFRPSTMEEDLEVQLLQLSTLMICHVGKELLNYRKELIQVAWNHLKGEETNAKHWAYLNICTFMDVYSTPSEIILSIFVELLKAHSTEASELVCRALDLLSPVLYRRLDVDKFTKSIRWTKKLLFDEGHSIPQLVHVLQMIVHHPSIFFQYRAQFVPQMVNALNKIASPHNCPIENRELAMTLIEVMLSYERTRQLMEENLVVKQDDKTAAFRISYAMFGVMFVFIIRVCLHLSEAKDHRSRACFTKSKLLLQSCLQLAKERCQKNIPIIYQPLFGKSIASHYKKLMQASEHDLNAVRKHFAEPSPDMRALPNNAWDRVLEPGMMTCMLDILLILVKAPDLVAVPFFNDNIEQILGVFECTMASPEKDVSSAFARLLNALLEAYGKVEEESRFKASWEKFHQTLQNVLLKRLLLVASPTPASAPVVTTTTTATSSTTMNGRLPPQQVPPMPKLVQQRLAKELTLRQAEHTGTGPRGILTTLRYLQIVCASVDPALPFVGMDHQQEPFGRESALEKFFPVLTSLASKIAKEYAMLFLSNTMRQQQHHAVAGPLAEEGLNTPGRKQLYSQILDVCFSLLSKVIHYKQAHAESQKSAMQLMAGLLEKLDVGDMVILTRIVKTIKYWLKIGALYQGTVNGFWTRLINLENKLSGLPLTGELMKEIHGLALLHPETASTFLASQSKLNHQILFTGLCSPCPKQAEEFWHLVFDPVSPNGLIKFKQDNLLLIATNKFWLPILFRHCVEAHLVNGNGFASLLAVLAFGDGDICVSAWKDLLPSLWATLTPVDRKSLADGILEFLASPLHPVTSTTKSTFEQHRKEYLVQYQRRKQEFRRLVRGIGTPHSSAANLFESLCGLPGFLHSARAHADVLPYLSTRMDCKYSYLFAAEQTPVVENLVDVYAELGEDDWVRGVIGARESAGYSLELAGEWRQALEHYRTCLGSALAETKAHKQALVSKQLEVNATATSLYEFRKRAHYFDDDTDGSEEEEELAKESNATRVKLLENRLQQCLRILGEWRTLHEIGRQEGNCLVTIEACYSQANLYKLPQPNIGVLATAQRSFEYAVIELESYIKLDKSVMEIEDGLKKCLKIALSTPYMSKAHNIRFTEMDESVTFHLRAIKHPELRLQSLQQLSQIWLSRGPPASLSCSEWAPIMNWRCEFLRMVQDAATPLAAEEASLLIQSAKHARSKSQVELSDFYFHLAATKSKAPNMTNERVKSMLNSFQVDPSALAVCYAELEENRNKYGPLPTTIPGTTTAVPQKNSVLSEIHRLRGRVLSLATGNATDLTLVEQALGLALQADQNNARIWLDWGRALLRSTQSGNQSEAAVCIAKAIALGYAHARFLIPALLLDRDGASVFLLEFIPPATFIPWISTFILHASLSPFAKASLEALIVHEPHATLHELALAPSTNEVAKILLEKLAKHHPEIVQENDYLCAGLMEKRNLLEWRGKSLRIPGTRRKLDRLVVDGKLCGRAATARGGEMLYRISLYSDDGRAPVRFAVHETSLPAPNRHSLVYYYLFFALLDQENHLLECFSPPAVFGLTLPGSGVMVLEKDTACQSVSHLLGNAQVGGNLTRWFTKFFTDLELFFIARKRMIFQLAAHFVATVMSPIKIHRINDHLLLGKGIESTFVVWGAIGGEEDTMEEREGGFEIAPLLQDLITPQGMAGPFATALTGMVRLASRNDVRQTLALFLGDEHMQRIKLLEEDLSTRERDERVIEAIQLATGTTLLPQMYGM